MPNAQGTDVVVGIKKASAWGTAVACGASDGLIIKTHSIKKNVASLIDDSLGFPHARNKDDGAVEVTGDVTTFLRYEIHDLALALVMGATGGAPVQQGATAAYKQTMYLAGDSDGLFATLAGLNGVDVEEFPSAKLLGFTLSGRAGEPVDIAYHVAANDRVEGSAVNTTATMANVTWLSTKKRVLFSQAVFRMNTQSAAALASPADVIAPASFELSVMRKLKGVHAAGQANLIDEPTNDGQTTVTLKVAFPRYASNAHFTAHDAGTIRKMDIVFTGAVIEGAYSNSLTFLLPALAYTAVDLPVAPGIMEHPLEFACLSVDAAVNGMAGLTAPVGIEIINTRTTNVLA